MDVGEGGVVFLECRKGVCLLLVIQPAPRLLVVPLPLGERFVVEVAAQGKRIPQPLLGLFVGIQTVSKR